MRVMKNKIMLLMALAMFVSSVAGCGCCRRVRDWVCRGAICRPAAPLAAQATAAPPVAACPSCPPVVSSYDPGCGYGEQTYGYGSYPIEGGVIDSGWSSSCPDCQGPSYTLPSDSGYSVESGTVMPGPVPENGA